MKCTVFLWQFLVWCFWDLIFFFFFNHGILIGFKKERKRKNVCLQPWEPTMSWAASKAEWTAGQGRWFCLSALLLWDLMWSPAPRSGAFSTGKMWNCWRKCRGSHKVDQRAEAPVLCRQAERIGVQFREDSGETLWHLPVPKGATRELEKDFLWGLVGQGWTSFNWKKVGLD